MSAAIELRKGAASARINPTGAELVSLVLGGQELIWPGDPALWPRQSPVLFPFCGWVRDAQFRAKGRIYHSAVHGFAPNSPFQVEQTSLSTLRLVLQDDERTRGLFPFAFRLTVDVALSDAGLSYDFSVQNPGWEVLPYALGFHPGFRWPFDGGAREAYRVVFDGEETAQGVETTARGLFTPNRFKPAIAGADFDVLAALKARDSTVLLQASTRAVSFIAPTGRAIRVETDNFPHWVFWSLPPAPYLCIEGWTGQGDPDGFEGDIMDKPGQIHLAPGHEGRHRFSIQFVG